MEFEKYLNSAKEFAKEFVEKSNELTKNVEAAFRNLDVIKQVLDEVLKYATKVPVIADACMLLVSSDYLVLLFSAVSALYAVRQIQPLESELPQSLQPKVRFIKSHMDSIKETLEKVDATMIKISKKILEARPRGYKLNEQEQFEMEMWMDDLKSDLETAKDYQKGADEELQSLWPENRWCLAREGAVAVGANLLASVVAGALAGATGSYLSAKCAGEAVSKGALQQGATIGATVGVAKGLIKAAEQLKSINALIIGASIAGLYLCLKGLVPKIQLSVKLSLIIRNYSDMTGKAKVLKGKRLGKQFLSLQSSKS